MQIIDIKRPIVLATASEARRQLVRELGIKFIPHSVDIDELSLRNEKIDSYVRRLAFAKAEAVIPSGLDALIVTVDTAVGVDDTIIGKPRDEQHAREILGLLSGRSHDVVSAIAIRDVANASVDVNVTRTEVTFAELSEAIIEWYIWTGEWKGRAGAYAIQGKGAALVKEINGCFTNVIGISIPAFLKILEKAR